MKKIVSLLVALLMVSCAFLAVACGTTPESQNPELSSISITSQPTKKSYNAGEEFDKAGMVVTAKYSDDTSKAVTNYTLSKTILEKEDTSITVSYTEGSVTKSATITELVVDGSAEEELEALLTGLVAQLSELIEEDEGEIPEFMNDFLDSAVSSLMKALRDAGITNGDIKNLMELFVEVQADFPVAPEYPDYPNWGDFNNGSQFDQEGYDAAVAAYNAAVEAYYELESEYNFELVNFILETAGKFYNTGITNTKISNFIWELFSTFNSVVRQVIEGAAEAGADIPTEIDAILNIYDEILALGKTQFTKAFKAFLDLAKLNITNTTLIDSVLDLVKTGAEPTKEEFIDIILALRDDVVDSLEILGVSEMSAILNIFKPVGLFAVSVNFSGMISDLEYEIEELELQISEYEQRISELELAEGNEVEIDRLNNYIADNNANIESLREMIASYEEILDSNDALAEYMNDICGFYLDSYGLVRTSLLATLNSIDSEMAGVIYDVIVEEEGLEALVIVIGKLVNTALNANGGLTKTNIKAAIASGLEIISGMEELLGDSGIPEEFKEGYGDMVDKLYADAAKFKDLSYDATLGEGFEDNLIIIIFVGTSSPDEPLPPVEG